MLLCALYRREESSLKPFSVLALSLRISASTEGLPSYDDEAESAWPCDGSSDVTGTLGLSLEKVRISSLSASPGHADLCFAPGELSTAFSHIPTE